jgi:hypothetical protein
MQPSIGLPPRMIQEMLGEFPIGVKWWFRLHPRQLGSQVESDLWCLYKDNKYIIIPEATNSPLPALMTLIDLHVTCFSSCIFEAAAFDVPTILIHKMGREYFNEHIQLGNAKLCIDAAQLKQEIGRCILEKKLLHASSLF